VALDHGKNVAMNLGVEVPFSVSARVEILKTTPLDPKEESAKIYCATISLVVDAVAKLTAFGPS
jgi:hypothetical protein